MTFRSPQADELAPPIRDVQNHQSPRSAEKTTTMPFLYLPALISITLGYWGLFALIQVLNLCSLAAGLLMLPGNWLMVLTLALFVGCTSFEYGPGWIVVALCALLAGIGEVLETLLGSAAAAKKGASRRAMLLSLAASIAGGLLGTAMLPIPFIGSLVGAVLGAAAGAFAGAWVGEAWIGTAPALRHAIGTAAMKGRLTGMAAKLLIGILIFFLQLGSFLL